MNEFQVQKRSGGAVHAGYEHKGFISSGCGAGHSHNQGLDNVTRTWVKVSAAVTCKRCLKNIAKEAAPAPVEPSIDAHAAAVAQLRANREAEEEKKAAARRARNRTNYASDFHRQVKDAIGLKF